MDHNVFFVVFFVKIAILVAKVYEAVLIDRPYCVTSYFSFVIKFAFWEKAMVHFSLKHQK